MVDDAEQNEGMHGDLDIKTQKMKLTLPSTFQQNGAIPVVDTSTVVK